MIATLGVVDHDGDVLLRGAIGRQETPIVPAHNWASVPLGRAIVEESGSEVVARLKFNLAVEAAKEWYSAIRFDFEHPPVRQNYSWGFTALPGGAEDGIFEGKRVRFLKPLPAGGPGLELHEVSPVLLGASVNTRTVGVKRCGDDPGVWNALAALEHRRFRDHLEREEAREHIFYVETSPSREERELAEAVKAIAAKDLGLILLDPFRWYDETDAADPLAIPVDPDEWRGPKPVKFRDRPLWGFAWRGRAWLQVGRDPEGLVDTAAHETAHLAGYDEAQAAAYGASFAKAWVQARGELVACDELPSGEWSDPPNVYPSGAVVACKGKFYTNAGTRGCASWREIRGRS